MCFSSRQHPSLMLTTHDLDEMTTSVDKRQCFKAAFLQYLRHNDVCFNQTLQLFLEFWNQFLFPFLSTMLTRRSTDCYRKKRRRRSTNLCIHWARRSSTRLPLMTRAGLKTSRVASLLTITNYSCCLDSWNVSLRAEAGGSSNSLILQQRLQDKLKAHELFRSFLKAMELWEKVEINTSEPHNISEVLSSNVF